MTKACVRTPNTTKRLRTWWTAYSDIGGRSRIGRSKEVSRDVRHVEGMRPCAEVRLQLLGILAHASSGALGFLRREAVSIHAEEAASAAGARQNRECLVIADHDVGRPLVGRQCQAMGKEHLQGLGEGAAWPEPHYSNKKSCGSA